jgi:surface antigen
MKENLIRRKRFSVDWRADPKLDTGDVITIGVQQQQQQNVRITSSTLSFSGAFRGNVKGVES